MIRCWCRIAAVPSGSAGSCRCMPANAPKSRKCAPATSPAAVGLKDVTTGDTLCDTEKAIILEKMEFPEPVISVAVEPKTKVDQEKNGHGASASGQRGSFLSRAHRCRVRSDHH